MGYKLLILCHFKFLTMIYTNVRAGVIGAGASSRYGSGSNQKMRLQLRLRNTADRFHNRYKKVTIISQN
jgi:hypothetical protein